ncbi:hypothetical protein [uncultured Erythrobacter sp.]|uniref:hypothetical protein n=1 Tax=uncultured Erythrobacter sp. TaxID=263913 RepID=UPI0026310736|nr:hypothetical protein [uncultured Erythrobacter sp.]
MNKILVAAVLPLLALSACGSDVDENADGTTISADGTEMTFGNGEGETNMVITGPDGEASFQSGPDVTPNLPDGWTIFPRASILSAMNIDGVDQAGTVVVMQVDADIEDIIAHYRAEAEATEHKIQMELTTGNARIIGGEGPDGSSFSVSVVPDADGGPATVQLTVGKGE